MKVYFIGPDELGQWQKAAEELLWDFYRPKHLPRPEASEIRPEISCLLPDLVLWQRGWGPQFGVLGLINDVSGLGTKLVGFNYLDHELLAFKLASPSSSRRDEIIDDWWHHHFVVVPPSWKGMPLLQHYGINVKYLEHPDDVGHDNWLATVYNS
jgi:hypothetical protein